MFRRNRTAATFALAAGFWLLRRGPVGLGIAASLVLASGILLQLRVNQIDAKNAAALAAGPPAIIEIANATPSSGANGVNEVVLQSELVWEMTYDLWYEESSRTDYVAMFPLVAAGSINTKEILGYALFQAKDDSFETLTPETVKAWLVDEGALGPVLNLNGALRGAGKWQDHVEDAFVQEGIAMPANPIVIWPYVDGREAAFAPADFGGFTIFGVFSKIAGALGLLALLKLAFAQKSEDMPEIEDPDTASHVDPVAFDPAPQRKAAPLWKQRSGLVDEEDYVPAPTRHEPLRYEEPVLNAPAVTPARSKFGIRKVLIGIVGGLFFLGLAATVSDLIGKSSEANALETRSIEETVAQNAATAIVPDADPNRHWTDIDVAPIAEWFVAKFFLAIAGDVDAQILLGGMLIGLFVAMFALRWFFIVRRALRPKTTARFDSMGLN
ncbi:hypothetical protein SAMN05444287_3049 [Octadecabacter temperatus]|uniref:Uncharacterized protein n=1 Tax=Octadecabacter temperatus TaxID=1458307 RepID=A0A0K0Y8S0_9RHOB|nr:hypothetical protein [Octadecabacter temperatus]AKS47310.1 hypothetical protein OSB_27860 [Octadecabacter temperatus]SIO44142.1 hypothetical protein SAMN05444287_3049 [Octadecabacter temperatus]